MTETVPAGRYEADTTHSSVTFRIKHFGLAWYTARFGRFSATLDFHPDAIERMRIEAEVEIKSVRTDYEGPAGDWNAALAEGADLFDAGRHPTARFVSSAVHRTGEATATVVGDLTLRGHTRPLSLDTVFNGGLAKDPFDRTLVGFSATGIVRRSEFGMDFMLGPLLPDEVQPIIETEFVLKERSSG